MNYQLDPIPAIFDMKVSLTPKELNKLNRISDTDDPIYYVLLDSVKAKLERRCSTHGWVVPDSIQILSRTMGHLENGRYTGNVIFHVQLKADVLNPAHGEVITATVKSNNEMGIMAIYNHKGKDNSYEALKVLVVLEQLADESAQDYQDKVSKFKAIEKETTMSIQLLKSRFQINDEHILSVGEFYEGGAAAIVAAAEEDKNAELPEAGTAMGVAPL